MMKLNQKIVGMRMPKYYLIPKIVKQLKSRSKATPASKVVTQSA